LICAAHKFEQYSLEELITFSDGDHDVIDLFKLAKISPLM
jgi:hypothetical protein